MEYLCSLRMHSKVTFFCQSGTVCIGLCEWGVICVKKPVFYTNSNILSILPIQSMLDQSLKTILTLLRV